MSTVRRSRRGIARAIARIQNDDLKPLDTLAGTVKVELAGLPARVTAQTLHRWATEGRKRSDGERAWLDAIKRGGTWYSSAAAIGRFLEELAAKVSQAG